MIRFKNLTKHWRSYNPAIHLPIVFSVVFFVIGFITLPNYGINWDEPIHWYRGQAYLHYYLTGKEDFSDLPEIAEHQRARVDQNYLEQGFESVKTFRRSYYQDNSLSAKYFFTEDSGHPPLNGILAALTNYIFYQKLGILGDIESHHVFNLLVSSLLVFIVARFAYQLFGAKGSFIASFMLITYPLFFAESHFNIKDPVETAFFAGTIWAFWQAFEYKKPRWLLVSGVFFGLALGTKFNAFFILPIIGTYALFKFRQITRAYIYFGIMAAVIAIAIFYLSWPYLWTDPVKNFLTIVNYYQDIGTGTFYKAEYLVAGFNLFPLYWITITTPIFVIAFTIIGIAIAIKSRKQAYYLLLLWLLVPILRASIPNSTIYGGIRQILEFLPAMVLLATLSVTYTLKRYQKITLIILGIVFIVQIGTLVKYHPNENVYFNAFVGGLRGAKERNVPYWGNSFGNAYWPALKWLNENAEPNAKLALIQGTGLNIPQEQLRPDIQYGNSFWSGSLSQGEYLLELTHNEPVKVYPYAWNYVERLLTPVYEVTVDGVAIAKLWKNDFPYQQQQHSIKPRNLSTGEQEILVNLREVHSLTRFQALYNDDNCVLSTGNIYLSLDGKTWIQADESIPALQISGSLAVTNTETNYFFAGDQARFIRYIADSNDQCILNNPDIMVTVF